MDTAIRRKRSHDGQASLRRAELEEQLAELRDQEAELVRAIELVVADEKAQKLSAEPNLPLLGEKMTAEPKDYDLRLKLVGENRRRRAKTFWGDIRRVITALKNVKNLNSVFGIPVQETPWGKHSPKHIEHYLSVISTPMDLRTVKTKLGDDENGQQYSSPHEVAADIRLIADNCTKFNTGAQNEGVRKLAENLLQQFDRKWRENSFEERWQKELVEQQHEDEELKELQTAANGGVVEKARYFERCTARRLQSLSTSQPVEYKPFTWEQKRKLSQACACVGEETCSAILGIISESSQLPTEKNGIVSVRLDDLPDNVLYRIQKRVEGAPKVKQEEVAQPAAPVRQAADAEAAAPSSAPVQTADAPVSMTAQNAQPTGEREGAKAVNGQETADQAKDHAEPEGTDPGAGGSRPESDAGDQAPANGNAAADGGPAVSRDTQNSSSSGSDNSSSSSDDANSKGSSNNSDQGEGRNSADSQQGESGAAATKDVSPREKHPSTDGAETVLVSRNVPLGDEKPAPSILKAKDDAKEIQIENEADWAVPADDDDDDVQPMEEDIPANEQAKRESETPAQKLSPGEPATQTRALEEAPTNGVTKPDKDEGAKQGEEKPTDMSAQADKPAGLNAQDVENDDSPSRKRKLDDAIPDKEHPDGEPQKKISVTSPQAVNSSGVVREEN